MATIDLTDWKYENNLFKNEIKPRRTNFFISNVNENDLYLLVLSSKRKHGDCGRHGNLDVVLDVAVVSEQTQKKLDQNDKADPEKQPALEENDLKPADGETQHAELKIISRLKPTKLIHREEFHTFLMMCNEASVLISLFQTHCVHMSVSSISSCTFLRGER